MEISSEFSYIAMGITILLTVIGQIFVKMGSAKVNISFRKFFNSMLQIVRNPWLLAGFLLTIIAPIAYFIALVNIPLSVAFSLNAINYILVSAAGYFIWKETMSLHKILGIVMVVFGVIMIGSTL